MASMGLAAAWVWRSPSPTAALARMALLPAAMLFRGGVAVRNAAYDAGWLAAVPLPAPSIGFGNLSVGGTGKTPLAAHAARGLTARGSRVGVVLRGVGGDEAVELAEALPGTVIAAHPDRRRAAADAVSQGARVLVLDDCLQHRRVRVDAMVAVVAAESWDGRLWPLPAGPWREGAGALRRADVVIVTCKSAVPEDARRLADRLAGLTRGGRAVVAGLGIVSVEPLAGGAAQAVSALRGADVLAVCGIGAPAAFAGQLAAAGARVVLRAFADHHAYDASDVARILAQADGRTVVTTAKDAVKLASLWPREGPPCLVARLGVTVLQGASVWDSLLDRAAQAARATIQQEAATAPLQDS